MKNLNHTCNPEADKYCAEGADPNRHDLAFPADWIGQHPSHTGGCTCPIGENEKEPMTMTELDKIHLLLTGWKMPWPKGDRRYKNGTEWPLPSRKSDK